MFIGRAYTLASTVGAIVQYCLRNQENPHISAVCSNYYYFIFHVNDYTPDLIRILIVAADVIRFERKFPIRRSLVRMFISSTRKNSNHWSCNYKQMYLKCPKIARGCHV